MSPSPQSSTLMLGDCLLRMQEIPDASVDCIVCDLPFGTTQNAWDCCINLPDLWSAWKRICKPGCPIVLFAQQPFTTILAASNLKQLKTELIWQKTSPTGHLNAKKYPLKSHETILIFCDKTPVYNPQMTTGAKPYVVRRGKPASSNYGSQDRETITVSDGSRYPTSVLRFAKDPDRVHPTQKPVALLENLILTYSNLGDVILDCTMGSGSTGVAAIQTGRSFIGIEQDQTYFEIATGRIKTTSIRPVQEAA